MKKHPRLKRWLTRIGIFVGLVAIFILVAILAQAVIATQKLKSIHVQLERDSIPLSWHELHQQFSDIGAHLAAQPKFFAALDNLTNLPHLSNAQKELLPVEGYAELPEPGGHVPPDVITALNDRVGAVAATLEAVREAVATEPFWLVVPTNAFDVPTLSRLATVRQAARLFNMSAILYAENDDPSAATQAVLDGISLAEVPHRGSLLIDELVRVACEGLAVRSLEYVLAKTDPSPGQLRELSSKMSTHSDMRTGILGEIVYTKQIYAAMPALIRADMRTIVELSDSEPWQYVIAYLPVSSGWIRMNEAYHLELLHQVVGIWDLPWQDFTNRYAQVSDAIPWPYFLTNLSKDVYSSAKNRELMAAGAWRCGRIAIAIELYSQDHDGLPRTLRDLVPEYLEAVPTEPFFGRPFVYAQDGNSGTLSFACPDLGKDFKFKVLANKKSIEPKN